MKILNICKSFFDFLNSSKIRYCHWKSNSHLDKALYGDTDLDILIHREDKEQFEGASEKFFFKKIISPVEKQFPGLEDYLGFDYETGRFIHLHIHYNLILGQKYIKNHHLPIEDFFLKNLQLKYGVAIPSPEFELILLIIRAHMKLDSISLFKHAIRDLQGHYYCPFPGDIEEELQELITNSDMEKFNKNLSELNLPIHKAVFIDFINKFFKKKYKCYDALLTQRKILSSLKGYRRQKGIPVLCKYFYLSIINSRGLNPFIHPKKKTITGNGKIFSIVGADGSGKSTVIVDLEKWLSWKLSVNRYYYGIPKILTIKCIDIAIRILNKLRFPFLTIILNNCLWIYIAKLRYKVFLSSNEDIKQGRIVLTDRFPLKEFQSMEEPMDGPRLIKYSTKIGHCFSNIEAVYYNSIKYPDFVFVLQVGFKELRKRKKDLGVVIHKIKAAAVNSIEGDGKIILIDANKPYDEVQLNIKRKIWGLL